MKIKWNRDGDDLEYGGIHFRVTCKVRNEIDLNYIRRLHDPKEVIYALYDGEFKKDMPYMPRKFPKGIWKILSLEVNEGSEFSGLPGFTTIPKKYKFAEKDYGPIKIRTDAGQDVNIWSLDEKGGYDKKTNRLVRDGGYLIHTSIWTTSWGCGLAQTEKQIRKLCGLLATEMSKGDVFIEVT